MNPWHQALSLCHISLGDESEQVLGSLESEMCQQYTFIDCQSQTPAYLCAFQGKVAKAAFPGPITSRPELCMTSEKTFCGCSLNLFERRLYSVHKSIANNKAAHSAGECWIYYGWCNLLNCCLHSFVIINHGAARPKEQFGPLLSYSIV